MSAHQFRVTIEDLVTGHKQVVEFARGDYALIPFAPCNRASVQAYLDSGTHLITVREHGPEAPAREVHQLGRVDIPGGAL